jgi:hypothetical protein
VMALEGDVKFSRRLVVSLYECRLLTFVLR